MHKNPRVRTARLKERLLVNYVYMFKERGRGGGRKSGISPILITSKKEKIRVQFRIQRERGRNDEKDIDSLMALDLRGKNVYQLGMDNIISNLRILTEIHQTSQHQILHCQWTYLR